MSEYDIPLEGARFAGRSVTIQGALAREAADLLVLTLHERTMVDKVDRHIFETIDLVAEKIRPQVAD